MKKRMKKEVCGVSVRLVRKCSITRQCCQLHSLPKDPSFCSSPSGPAATSPTFLRGSNLHLADQDGSDHISLCCTFASPLPSHPHSVQQGFPASVCLLHGAWFAAGTRGVPGSWQAHLHLLLDPSLMNRVHEMGQEAGSCLFLSFLASSQCQCDVAGVKIPQQNRHGSCWSAAAFPNTCHSQDAEPCYPAQHLTAATSTAPLADCLISAPKC